MSTRPKQRHRRLATRPLNRAQTGRARGAPAAPPAAPPVSSAPPAAGPAGGTPADPPMPANIDDIMDEMHTLADTAGVRVLTDAEATRFERLEGALAASRRSQNIVRRQAGYEEPVPGDLPALVGVHTSRRDDTYNAAFNHYLRTGQPNGDLVNAQGVGSDPAGGYLVSPQFRQRLIEVMKAYGGLAAEVDSFNTERGGDVEYPSVDDTASVGAITAEATAFATGTDLAFGTILLKAWKYTSTGADASAGMRVSWELLQDAEFDVEALIARALGTRIARKQAADWALGTGTGMPFGISHAGLTADVVLAAGNAITYQKLLDIESALDPAYEQNAKWCFNKAAWQKIRAVVDTTGRPLVDPQYQAGIGESPRRELLGYPVVIDQAMGNPATLSQRWGVLGDLREAYAIRRVADFSLVVNPYSRAIFAQTEYSAWARADGNIQNRKAFALVQNNAA